MGGRALLVEEDEATANALVPLLHKVGIEVEWVADAASAAGRLEVPSGLDAAIVESAVAADRGLDLVERAKAAGLCAVLLLGDGEQAPPGASDVAVSFPVKAASLYAALGDVADAAVDPAKILTPPSNDDVMPPPTWSVPESSAEQTAPSVAPSNPEHPTTAPPEKGQSDAAPAIAAAVEESDDTDPKLVEAARLRVQKGRDALAAGRLELAIIELDSAAALHPKSKVAKGFGAFARFSRVRDVAKSIGDAHRAVVAAAETTASADLWVAAAEIALDIGLPELAKKRAQKALAINPQEPRAQEIVESA